MNRLRGSCIYLAGPMDEVPDLGADWREWITPELQKMGIGVYNPCNKPTDIACETDENRKEMLRLRDLGEWDEYSELVKEIVSVDLRMVDVSDAIILNVDKDYHMCGSYNEQAMACLQRKPVIVHCKQGKGEIPGWLFGHCNHELFFDTWDGVMRYIHAVDNYSRFDPIEDGWKLFNHELVFGGKDGQDS